MPGPVDCRVATGDYRAWWPGFLERLKMVSKEANIKMLLNQMGGILPDFTRFVKFRTLAGYVDLTL